MFMVINKDKIVSYIVSFSTVAILFVMSVAITKKQDEILQTSVNIVTNNMTINSTENISISNNEIKSEYNIIGEN